MVWVLSERVRPMRLDREECNDLPHFFQRFIGFLISKAGKRCGDAAAVTDEGGRAASGVDGKDGSLAKEAAEDGAVASTLTGDGNDSHGGRLVVDHADGDLVGDQGG